MSYSRVRNRRRLPVLPVSVKMGSDRLYREVIYRLTMTEGRQSQVVLLDDRRLDILIKPKLYAGELLDMVASHFSLKEKEYFGLAYLDDTGHHSWLQLDRRVLEHEFPKKSSQSTLVLYFRIKYFVESIRHLRDSTTIEAFYLQAQSLVYQGTFEVSSDTAFHLAALVLQATHGDYINDETTRQQLKKLPVLPTSALQEHPSLTVCEGRVIEQYKTLKEQSRGTAIVNYLRIVEAVPTYGVHYYEVKDKGSLPWWLGISYKGISQYDQTDRKIPRKVFLWKQLENLYFRDRKFSIEVYDPRRVPLSRRTFGPGNVTVHVWFASTPSLTKCIWSMAIAQHQFYLDRKHNKALLSVSRSLSEIAAELSHSVQSLSSTDSTPSLSRSASSLSLPALKIDSDCCEEVKTEIVEMFVALKARKEALEEALHKKSEELKKLCLQEGKLTGVLPPEMPLTPGEQIPIIERRKGTELSLDDKIIWKTKTEEDEDLSRLELEYEIQSKIANAALKLATDPTVPKNIRRQRKVSSLKACSKLKEIEQKLEKLRKQIETKKQQQRQHSDDEPSEDNMSHSTDENDPVFQDIGVNLSYVNIGLSPQESSIEDAKNSVNREMMSPVTTESHIICSTSSSSAPPSPTKPRHIQQLPVSQHLSPDQLRATKAEPILDGQGYTPSSVYQTQTSYRNQQYPTLPTRSPSSYSAGAVIEYSSNSNSNLCDRTIGTLMLRSPYQNRFESTLDIEGSNLYSVPTQRTSQAYDSQDDILACVPNNLQDLGLMSRHNSLDRSRRQSYQRYRRYIENSQSAADFSRPSSVQPSISCDEHLSYNQFVTEADVHQYHNSQHLQHHLPVSASCTFHHPHHFHHHRHSQQQSCQPEGASRTNTKLDKLDRYQDPPHLQTKNDIYGSYVFSGNPPFQTSYLPHQTKHLHILNDCQNDFTKEILQSDVPKSRENIDSSLSYSDPKSALVCHSHMHNSLSPLSVSSEEQTSHITASMAKCNVSSKRTKGWNETSLDSPVPQKKYEGKETRANNYNSKSFSVDPVYRHQSDETLSRSHQILPCATVKHLPVSSQVCTFKDELAPLIPNQSDVEISVLNYGHFQPYWEETKPYEISDFYKYSTKHRKQNQDAASQSLHTKVSASKTPVRSGLCHTTVPKIMSPVLEHSAIASSIYSLSQNNSGRDKIKHHTAVHGEVLLSDEMRTEEKFPPLSNTSNLSYMFDKNSSEAPVSNPFQDELFDWHKKREKFIKTTLV